MESPNGIEQICVYSHRLILSLISLQPSTEEMHCTRKVPWGSLNSVDPQWCDVQQQSFILISLKKPLQEYLAAYGGSALDEWKKHIWEHDVSSARYIVH